MQTQPHDILTRVHEFNRIGQTVPPGNAFNVDRVCFYTGMQCEELAEKLKAIATGAVTSAESVGMMHTAVLLDKLAKEFKEGMHQGAVHWADPHELLDADFDILVVSAGSAMYQTPHFKAGMAHVLDCNDAKFPNGVVTRDPVTGKILKPAGWKAPELTPFIADRETE